MFKFACSVIISLILLISFIFYGELSSTSTQFTRHEAITKTLPVTHRIADINNNKNKKIIFILSIDGGGMMGLLPVKLLQYIESQAQQPIHDIFDLIVGTSSGAVTAGFTSLKNTDNQARFPITQILNMYRYHSKGLFESSIKHTILSLDGLLAPKYSTRKKYTLLDTYLSQITLQEAFVPIMIPAVDVEHMQAMFFKSWEHQHYFFMKDILSGATNMPALYAFTDIYSLDNTVQYTLIDGATFMDSPTIPAWLAAKELYPNKHYIIVSLGAGSVANNHFISIKPQMGILQWNINLLKVIGFADIKSSDIIMQSMVNLPGTNIINYYRFDTILDMNTVSAFNTSSQNIETLERYGQQMIEENKNQLNELIQKIIDNKAYSKNERLH
ncbi:patatin-like phospholipase family protein [Shewanella surugensis]|uniref:Patatin-like phospholipase family protein n=1 Tax=Shewanella surugensis TaxID=212020 RepID=A0ABT0LCB6_9GAMM|nr:patatin-like phospholipase family protein [Shewanella surugensis]MCL1124992.1 patatin-like phospholipase family protein [Shewanella surugensis]